MKKHIFFSILIAVLSFQVLHAQNPIRKGEKQLNFGTGASVFGIPFYVGMDFGIHEDISIGPIVSFRAYSTKGVDVNTGNRVTYTHTAVSAGFTGDYHFNNLLDIPREFDIYAGATVSYFFVNSNAGYIGTAVPSVGVNPHVGARYNFSPKWSVQVQVEAGTHTGALGGLTLKL